MSMRRQKFLLFRVYRFRDAKAYGKLYDAYAPRIRRYVTFKLPSRDDVDELTGEVFLRGWEYATSSQVENANALFYRIARNLIADFYRSRRITESLDNTDEIASQARKFTEELDLEEEKKLILKSLQKLKEEYKEVLIMKYLDEMSTKEIAQAIDKTVNNVRVLLHRAKRALKEIHE